MSERRRTSSSSGNVVARAVPEAPHTRRGTPEQEIKPYTNLITLDSQCLSIVNPSTSLGCSDLISNMYCKV